MWSLGDVVHQRAVIRELIKTRQVYLRTCLVAAHHDFFQSGNLKISGIYHPCVQITEDREPYKQFLLDMQPARFGVGRKLTYSHETIRAHKTSILRGMFDSIRLPMPEKPDFGMTVPQHWRDKANLIVGPRGDKPMLIYRPIIHSSRWLTPARSPDVKAYAEIFKHIRDQFFVVSIANLADGKEHIFGPEQGVDCKLHSGQLTFESMFGLFAEAAMAYVNPGFAPIIAQATGCPVVIVYGGHETFAIANKDGAHLAPTLAVEPINPCGCQIRDHRCDKRIDLPAAIEKVTDFASSHIRYCVPGGPSLRFADRQVDRSTYSVESELQATAN
jgi:hypothetical protein